MIIRRINKVILLTGLVLGCFLIKAQPSDSLYQSYISIINTGTPEQKADALLDLGLFWQEKNIDTSLKYTYQCIDHAKSFDLHQKLAKSYKLLCASYNYASRVDSALKYGNLAMEDRFISYLDENDLGATYFNLAETHRNKRNWLKAYTFCHEILKIPSTGPVAKFRAYAMLTSIMGHLDDYRKAMEYLSAAREFANSTEHPQIPSSITQLAAEIYMQFNKPDSALIYYDMILTDSFVLANPSLLQYMKINRAKVLIELEDYDGALHLLDSLEFGDAKGLIINIEANFAKGLSHLKLNQPKKAIKYLLKSLSLSNDIGYSNQNKLFFENLAKAYAMTEDFEKSAYYKGKIIELEDQEKQEATDRRIGRLEIEKLTQEKDKTIQELKYNQLLQENKLTQLKWLGLLLTVLAVSSIGVYYWYNKSKSSKLEEKISKNKLHALRATMNPHFLFNSINSLQYFILNSERYQAYNFITNFSKLLRSTLDNSNTLEASLEKEIELINSYIELEQIRLNHNFDFINSVDETMNTTKLKIPSMIVQPYVENSILHGLSNKVGDKQLKISVHQMNDQYAQFTIQDNGIGRAAAAKIKTKNRRKHLSIAVSNSMERIELLKKLGYKKSSISIEDMIAPNGSALGTKVMVQLPLLG